MDTATAEPMTPSLVDLEQQAVSVRSEMAALTITDQKTYDFAVEKRTQAANWLKNAREFFKSMKDPAYAAWKKICSNENLVCDPVEATMKQINKELVRYDQEQEQLRREEQARLEREARERAEAERIAQAEQLKAQGADEETIDEILEAPVQVTELVVAAPTYEKSKAVVHRDNWSGEVTDLKALVKYVAKNPQFIGLLQINQTALNAQARALKGTMAIPGVRPVNNRVVATGRG
jgi:hypothetical protein